MRDSIIKVSDFTTLPGARYKKDGDGSAEEFFEQYVRPRISKDSIVTIDFDNTWGYASSFLSELALEIAKECRQNKLDIRDTVNIISNDEPGLIERFWSYVDESVTDDN